MPSIHQQVVGQIKNIGRGNIFFPEQFEHLGSSESVRQSLSRIIPTGISA